MNKTQFIGNLTRDPELKTTNSGVSVCNFTIAVQRRYKNASGEYEADFIPIVVWKNQAESCHTYLKKGSKVGVSGSLQIRNYEDKEGNKRTIAEIIAEEVEFVGSKTTEAKPKQETMEVEPVDDSILPF